MTDVADFSGYVTRNNIRCADGRTILENAFSGNHQGTVPLVWEHGRKDVENILGRVELENRPDGVFGHAFFNKSRKGQHAKASVQNGDVKCLSIFADSLRERVTSMAHKLRDVAEGNIREVSLVIAGANPGATIETVNLAHSSDGEEYLDEALITFGEPLVTVELNHSAEDEESEETLEHAADDSAADILETLNPTQKKAVYFLLSQAMTHSAIQHSDESDSDDDTDSTDGDENQATDDESGADDNAEDESGTDPDNPDATKDAEAEDESDADADDADAATDENSDSDAEADDEDNPEAGDAVQHGKNHTQEGNSMTWNAFSHAAGGGATTLDGKTVTLEHGATSRKEAVQKIIKATMRGGDLKTALEDYVIEHGVMVGGSLEHGIENIDYLFPDPKSLTNEPTLLARRQEWVSKVLDGVKKQPMARIRTIHADITMEEARARGYVKGNFKEEEFFELIKRDTTPQTVYKRQTLHRDDVVDIVDLDVIAWMKAEMKLMLDEEIASAILIGDGRSSGDNDKIKVANVRPIASDSDLYVTNVKVNLDDANSSMEELVDRVIENRSEWRGTGTPTFYTSGWVVAKFLNTKDSMGRRIYSNLSEVAAVLRVAAIVEVEVFTRDTNLLGIMVNLDDYSIGTDKGGQATMFDDFNLEYNKLQYLLETRLSGALTRPKSAIVFRKTAASDTEVVPVAPTRVGNTITVPTVTGVVYKDAAGTTLVTGSPTTLTVGQKLVVKASAASGKYLASDAQATWPYRYDSTP